ncbi:MAG: tRNA uridine-5-carboxymethylaminomethyl(34) synthesis GTPase MnmE [Pseudomonadota bacterium]|nr:tRNA uridine-5-carboxymethylaminomethyl(34) synthesis GTPase MnmE [Pseudomonadota bacterium]
MEADLPTIVALASAPGRSGVAVLRVSGPQVKLITNLILNKKQLIPRMATCADILSKDGEVIDNGLALYFEGPNSYTGEDVLEIHCHGSPVIVDAIINSALAAGAVLAGPGEFTKRAFLNGKLDLYQAEAVASLIDSDSEFAAKSAIRAIKGEFSRKVHNAASSLTSLRVYVEACLDFTDEDIDFITNPEIKENLANLAVDIEKIHAGMLLGKVVAEGIKVVITGPTNAGKSTLFNLLTGDNDAIVTAESGTTRDVLKQKIKVGSHGLALELLDTAGIRDTTGLVEQEGIARSRQHLKDCDLVILVLSADSYTEGDFQLFLKKELEIKALRDVVLVLNKVDLLKTASSQEMQQHPNSIYISAKTGVGLEKLQLLLSKLCLSNSHVGDKVFIARKRHVIAIEKTLDHIKKATVELEHGKAIEILAEQLRLAQNYLGEITGEVSSDDLLGEIFSSFCVGK